MYKRENESWEWKREYNSVKRTKEKRDSRAPEYVFDAFENYPNKKLRGVWVHDLDHVWYADTLGNDTPTEGVPSRATRRSHH